MSLIILRSTRHLLTLAAFAVITLPTVHADGRFPNKLGDLTLEGATVYEDPGAGFSLRYETTLSSAKLDIYFYDSGLTNLGTGINDSVKQEFARIFAGIKYMEKRGLYTDVSAPKVGDGTIDLSGQSVPFLFGHTSFRQPPSKAQGDANSPLRQSFYLLTAYEGRFLKVRFTLVGDDSDLAFRQFNHVMADIERAFDKPAPSAALKQLTQPQQEE